MAKYAKSDAVQGGKCQIPKDLYRARVIGTKYGQSQKGYDMTTLSCEIIDPEAVSINGESYRITGRQFQLFLLHVPTETWGQAKVFEFMEKLRIDVGDEYDTELHKEYFLGMEFDIVLDSEEDVMRQARQPGEKEGKPITDGEGKPISNGWRISGDIQNVPQNCRPAKTDVPY